MSIDKRSVEAALSLIARRLRRARLNANLTQQDLATRVGVSLKTIRNAEDGQNISLETLMLLLQGIGRLKDIQYLLADGGPSPIELAERQGRARQRATGRRGQGKATADTWRW